MVDPARVRRLLDSLSSFSDRLRELAGRPPEEYLRDRYAARYLVQAAAQCCIDLANHVIASEGWRVPQDFRDAFTVLEENAWVPPELAGRLRALCGLRNRLVHLYEDVDDEKVRAALIEGLGDFDDFARLMASRAVRDAEGRD